METEPNTDTLRTLAPHWSLSGDDKLLKILQNTHKRIISKCQEVNAQLSEMTTALDDASISLQNVNNRFMALSNSQFIESRVYDDDVEVTKEPAPVKETPKPATVECNLSMIKQSLEVLESMHEAVTILRDSDTDSDTDDDDVARVVLKPKDLYAGRPLPYIIGSQPWKNKWHAGLVVEESDSDSTTSKPEKHISEYSDSEPEDTNVQTHKPDNTMSETSSELALEPDYGPPAPRTVVPEVRQTPSEMAAELARRLGGLPPRVEDPEPELPAPKPTAKMVYKPQQPPTGTIFSDEPPPLDEYQSESSPEDDDIFAELHRNKPYEHANKEQGRLNDDLFGFKSEEENVADGDIFSDFAPQKVAPTANAKQKSTLFEDESEPELFADKVQSKVINEETRKEQTIVKKPVGGISVFGTNNGAESIGAAILKRNIRKVSISDESDDGEKIANPQIEHTDQIDSAKKEKDIFDDLFAKSEKKENKLPTKTVEKDKEKKVDLFSDNLFDDIDDIFATNVVKMPKRESKNNQKSIFDDEDDLFAEIATSNVVRNKGKSSVNEKKDLFDSDDELFTDKSIRKSDDILPKTEHHHSEVDQVEVIKPNIIDDSTNKSRITDKNADFMQANILSNENVVRESVKTNESTKNSSKLIKETKSIFDSDSDSDIFSNINVTKPQLNKDASNNTKSDLQVVNSEITDKNNMIVNNIFVDTHDYKPTEIRVSENALRVGEAIKQHRSPSLFDDDDDDDLFTDSKETHITPSKDIMKRNEVEELSQSLNDTKKNIVNMELPTEDTVSKNDDIINEMSKSIKTSTDNNIENVELPTDDTVTKDVKISNEMSKSVKTDSDNNKADNKNIQNELFVETGQNMTITDIITEPEVTNEMNVENSTESTLIKVNLIKQQIETDIEHDIPGTQTSINNDFENNQTEDDCITQSKEFTDENIFAKILTEPPVFEKPKEPKRSKNVNALFDDDSDDEALFYRKSDVIDDNHEDFTPNINQDALFGLFHDEPPSIDVDFSLQNKNMVDQTDHTNNSGDSLFDFIPKSQENYDKYEKINTAPDDHSELTNDNNNSFVSPNTVEISGSQNHAKILQDSLEGSHKSDTDNKHDFHDIFSESETNEDLFSSIQNDAKTEKLVQTSNNTEQSKSGNIHYSTGVSKSSDKLNFKDSDEELFTSMPKPERSKQNTKYIAENQSVYEQLDNKKEDKNKVLNNYLSSPDREVLNDTSTLDSENINKLDSKRKTSNLENIQYKYDLGQKKEIVDSVDVAQDRDRDVKKIGKLKSMSFNIDVNALLPGASPKKQKSVGTVISTPDNTKISERNRTEVVNNNIDEAVVNEKIEKSESKLVKTISFDSEPNSDILDNKLSKERAKIQVKRRPSTRRARREAVRKSVIDLDDSTDNSSSIDDPPKPVKTRNEITTDIVKKAAETPKITSKIVYILNDEDIFDTKPTLTNKEINSNDEIKSSGTDPNNFKDKSENLDTTDGINTLGRVYKESVNNVEVKNEQTYNVANNTEKPTKSLFDDLSDEENELFKQNKKVTAKTTIFDSDNEDIFTDKSNIKVVRKEVIKGPLFGDDDDDGDLFGIKTKVVDTKPQISKPSTSKEATVSAQPVFDDPLSLLGDDD